MTNIFFILILGTMIISYVVDLVTELLNLRALREELPEDMADVYAADDYKKSQQYLRTRIRFGFLSSTFGLILTLGFWLPGGFGWLDELLRGFEMSSVLRGLVFIGSLLMARFVVTLPFSIYSTFVIEARFGFNKTTPKIFFADLIKGIVLSVLIGGPVLAGILSFFEYAGDWAWLYSWAAVVLIGLVLQYIAPTWIMPLFNKFMPLQDEKLKASILQLAEKVQFPLREIRVMDGSKRSTKSNAFFTGFGRNKRIALFDTLIEKHSTDELTAVVAHEMGHYKKKHIVKGMVLSFVHTGVIFFLLSVFLGQVGLFHAFNVQEPSVYAGLIFFGLLFSPVELLLGILMNILSRKHEFEADRFAAEAMGEPDALISGLKKLSRDNLSNLTPHPLHVFVNYSHPPVLQRIEALRQVTRKETVHVE